ncbi:peroxin 6 [Pseudovirgaria hyperparasitica]|uniref:Peroxisomal ATPase PEX6 n=1 Tax=Pseudovirgaria hyperparasitica TaxID=470096 RepID=A0A6A6W1A3_9PEZI|nr:peroxin 6 [Pseudovirgaria hyperparasitica]KAF2756698.1 peroxin 6 [Pseudovirgaria hyperparasitica]
MDLQNGSKGVKRRRRRRLDRPAISAHLLLDDRAKGEIGTLSEDLFSDLFPGYEPLAGRVHYVAICPWLPQPLSSPNEAAWTILPVKQSEKSSSQDVKPHSTVQFPASSFALQAFIHNLSSQSPHRTVKRDAPIEIRILDVVPLGLDTIYVSLDTDALCRLDDVHAKFGGGFGTSRPNGAISGPRQKHLSNEKGPRKRSLEEVSQQEKNWKIAVREALQIPRVVHTGILLPLPLPAHPITHVPPPPAKITACEPVSQGLILPSTKIVVLQSHGSSRSRALVPTSPVLNGPVEEDEDTSNEQFYSAVEERGSSNGSSPPDEAASSTDQFDSEMSGTDAGDLSDDPEDMISLSAPTLPPQSSGVLSAFTSATPRPFGLHTTGIQSPGSVFSSFTATTARGPSANGKVFKTQGLLERIPDESLHPKPGTEDDEEARVFVDTNTLVRLGCFSGDWVKLEVSAEPQSFSLGSWGLGSFGNDEDEEEDTLWRVARIYGLPDILAKKTQRYNLKEAADRRSSIINFLQPTSPSPVYLPPTLLTNLGEPSHLKIASLALNQQQHGFARASVQKPRLGTSTLPPFAKEVTLLKLFTPLSSERQLQPSLFAALKHHFEQKRRLIKSGDLIGIAIDENLGKAIFQGNNPEDDVENEELLSRPKADTILSADPGTWCSKSVAWFKVGAISRYQSESVDNQDENWGGVFSVDSASTKMIQAGTEQGKVPSTLTVPWQYYFGVRRLPASQGGPKNKGRELKDAPKSYVSNLQRRLRELISAATSSRAIHLGLPPIAILITSTQRHIGKATVVSQACDDLGLHTFAIDAFDILTEGGAGGGGDYKTDTFLKTRAERGLACGAEYTALLIKHVEALNADRMVSSLKEILNESRVLVATTTEVDKVPDGIRSIFTHELEMTAPDENEREGILRNIVMNSGVPLSPEVELSTIAMKTAALVAGDLVDVVDRAIVAKQNRIEDLARTASTALPPNSQTVLPRDIELSGGIASVSLTAADFVKAVDAARKNFADAIGAPKIPNVGWSDVGGLTHVKDALMETIQLPLARPELFAKGMKKRSGILFYGPPGTGKTLLAKAIATEFSLNFFSVKGPELLNMYIGESEANVRRVFQRARDARPCVVFFDELDSVAPKRGNQGDSGGVMDRIVSQLLAELDGMSNGEEGGGGVFVIGATNRPDLLDQALLRPGRFDKMLYLGVSDDHDKQLTILEALTRKFTLSPQLSLRNIANTLPFTYTGADLYALCSDAMLKAITRRALSVDAKVKAHNSKLAPGALPISVAYFFDHLATAEDTEVMVEEVDFMDAQRELVPSVSQEELNHYDRVRKTFEGAATKKDEGSNLRLREAGNPDDDTAKQMTPEQAAEQQALSRIMGHIDGLVDTGKDAGLWKVDKSKIRGKGPVMNHTVSDGKRLPSQGSDKSAKPQFDSTDDEDEYIIRTDHLKRNGSIRGKGKGKGKIPDAEASGDGGDDEGLYDD